MDRRKNGLVNTTVRLQPELLEIANCAADLDETNASVIVREALTEYIGNRFRTDELFAKGVRAILRHKIDAMRVATYESVGLTPPTEPDYPDWLCEPGESALPPDQG